MKSIYDISQDLGISKQMVYRYITSSEIESSGKKGRLMLYSEEAEADIKRHFSAKEIGQTQKTQNASMRDILENQLAVKDAQIAEKDLQIAKLMTALIFEQQKKMLPPPSGADSSAPDGGLVSRLLWAFNPRKTS